MSDDLVGRFLKDLRACQKEGRTMLVTERTAGPLAASMDKLEVDALRYRWLRDNTHSLSLLPVRANPNALYHEDSPEVWDSVIDDAMGKKT